MIEEASIWGSVLQSNSSREEAVWGGTSHLPVEYVGNEDEATLCMLHWNINDWIDGMKKK